MFTIKQIEQIFRWGNYDQCGAILDHRQFCWSNDFLIKNTITPDREAYFKYTWGKLIELKKNCVFYDQEF